MAVTLRNLSADDHAEIEHVRQFFRNYAAWLGVDLGYQNFGEEMASLPGAYAAPAGRLFFAELDGERLGRADQPGLGGAVVDLATVAALRSHRRQINNASPTLAHHRHSQRLRDVKKAV